MKFPNWTPDFFIAQEKQCLEILQDKWTEVPLANVQEIQYMKDGSLVRFRGMVQDMRNPEFFLSKYEVLNETNNDTVLRNGKYLDCATCEDNEIINSESNDNVTEERSTIIVVSTPGLNDWVTNIQKEERIPEETNENSLNFESKSSFKRSLEDSNGAMESEASTSSSSKKNRNNFEKTAKSQENALVISKEYLLNFPLTNRPGKVFQIKVYSDADKLKINDNVEFVGFLSLNPDLAQTGNTDEQDFMSESHIEAIQTRHPPPSLIPRLHCLHFRPLRHSNPLVNLTGHIALDQEHVKFLRTELHIVLTQMLLGDELAAEYLIYYLIAEIYLRKDLTALGKFTLNISNIPTELIPNSYGRELYEIVQNLVTKSHYFPMTLENMNDTTFIPSKDYDCDRLTSGLLQLSKNTRLILDETKLTPGKMNESGVRAIGALANIIREQQLSYDFKFYKMDFETDIPCLILSEGKSMLPSDFHVILKPEPICISTFNESVAASKVFLTPDLLNKIRVYLTKARIAEYELTDNVHTMVENHFVTMRQRNNSTGEDLHQLLVLARFICLSEGKSSLDEECWNRACQLETERKQRNNT